MRHLLLLLLLLLLRLLLLLLLLRGLVLSNRSFDALLVHWPGRHRKQRRRRQRQLRCMQWLRCIAHEIGKPFGAPREAGAHC